jgi:hypothetical protein
MSTFHTPATPLTPDVLLDVGRGELRMSGECYPEDPGPFFSALLAALPGPAAAPARLDATLRLSYVNSAATMWLRRAFLTLDALARAGTAVTVAWEYDADDDVVLELGRDLAQGLYALAFDERPIPAGGDGTATKV